MKTVLMPIEVPESDYCSNYNESCEHFDNTGGHGVCDLGIYGIETDMYGYLKPYECSRFAEDE